jgi:hypothetical protein
MPAKQHRPVIASGMNGRPDLQGGHIRFMRPGGSFVEVHSKVSLLG